MDRRRQRWLLIVLALLSTILLLQKTSRERVGRVANSIATTFSAGYATRPANATLGFGAIIAVSRKGSPRREGLILAANITELDITIPDQPKWTDADVKSIRAPGENSTLDRGSALAWLGHLNALRWFLSTNLETTLILEDDVDFDIHLRTTQIPQAAAAMRSLTSNLTVPPSPLTYNSRLDNYWGIANTWDLLYLGHCGDIFPPEEYASLIPDQRVLYPDPTLPPPADLHPYTSAFLERLNITDHTRMVHKSVFPLCTFGFALTRHSAYRMLHEFAPHEAPAGTMAYDVRVLEACRDPTFRCWTANPELFHHLQAPSEIKIMNEAQSNSDAKEGADSSGRLKAVDVADTPNIACGARSTNFGAVGDMRGARSLAYLRDVVGRQGKCARVSG